MVANGDLSIENAAIPKMNLMEISNLAEQFVLQYYTVMNQCPDMLHRFYSDDSMLVYESQPVSGQADIHSLLSKLNLKETRVIILKVDALKSHKNSALVQVSGELSVSGGHYRRFMRSFTLVEKDPSNFFVLADILRFQDRVYVTEKKQASNAAEDPKSKQTGATQASQAPPNGVPVDKKLRTESKVEEHFTRKPEAEHPQVNSPKVSVEPASQKPSEKPASESNVHLHPAPRQLEQVQATSSAQSKPQQQRQQQVIESQTPAPMSWAQRASGNAAFPPHAQPRVQATKAAAAEHPVTAGSTAQPAKMGGAPRPTRGGGGFNSAGGSGRSQQQAPNNREPGSDCNENIHGQTQQHGRGGFGASRGNMRGGDPDSSGNRGNRRAGATRGGNRGAGNAISGAPPQRC